MIFKKLRTRMIAHIIWVVTAVTVVTFIFVTRLNEQSIHRHLHSDAKIMAEIVENVLLTLMQDEAPRSFRLILPEFARMHHVKRIRIIDAAGRISYSSVAKEEGDVVKEAYLSDLLSKDVDTLSYHVAGNRSTTFFKWRKLLNRTRCHKCHDASRSIIGVLCVETSDELSLGARKSGYIVLGGIYLGVIALLSLATVALFIRSVDRPVQELRDAMDAIENGDFSARVQSSNRDELGQLAQGMNSMAEKLDKAKAHLMEHHEQEILQAGSLAKTGELAASLAHDIKNPISGIVFATNSILRHLPPDDNRREILEEIVRQANQVEDNLEALLGFARQSRLVRSPTDINAAIERIQVFMRQQSDIKSITMVSQLEPDIPKASVDPKQIEQVLLNLITNAIQAMPEGGTLTITTRHDEFQELISISVKDTGVGIPTDLQDRVFQPFFTTKVKGVGLGLTTSNEVIARHRGRIYFESQKGIGTTFTVELPIGRQQMFS